MHQHTPGPWGCSPTSNHAHDYRLTRSDGGHLPYRAEANDHGETRANARLIAAAPDMLALLEELIDIEGPQPGTGTWANKVLALVAKTKGDTT